ncbi:MAG: hypothetical protein GWN36_13220, partial [Gemmatimonadetes bacterium]|nr:hypothetical protein [Gemmatimonadota bacterium]
LALIVAARLGAPLAAALDESIGDPQVRAVTAFLLLFFGTLLIASLVGVGAYRLVHRSGLKATDRTLGLFFGAVRGVVVVGIVVLVVRGTPFRDHSAFTEAYLAPAFGPVADFLHRLLPAEYGEYFTEEVLPMGSIREHAREAGEEALDQEGLEKLIRERLKSDE